MPPTGTLLEDNSLNQIRLINMTCSKTRIKYVQKVTFLLYGKQTTTTNQQPHIIPQVKSYYMNIPDETAILLG